MRTTLFWTKLQAMFITLLSNTPSKRSTFEKLAYVTFLWVYIDFMYKICKLFIWFFNSKFLLKEPSRKISFSPQNSYILWLYNTANNIFYIGIQFIFIWFLPFDPHNSKRWLYYLAHLWTNKLRLVGFDWLTKVP